MKLNEPGTYYWLGKYLAADQACKAIFWPTPGIKERIFDSSGDSAEDAQLVSQVGRQVGRQVGSDLSPVNYKGLYQS